MMSMEGVAQYLAHNELPIDTNCRFSNHCEGQQKTGV